MGARYTYEFRGPTAETIFDLTPEAALAAFRIKGLKPTFAWQDMLGAEHLRAFTVAKMMDTDLLMSTRGLLDRALDEGHDIRWFKANLIPELQTKGWWGKADVIDPLTGNIVNAQLGSARRLETIFRTNMQTGYSIGSWQAIQRSKSFAPYLMYDAIDDHRTRPEHAAWDGIILPVDDPWWDTHHPTNGWNCRCGTLQLTEKMMKRRGLTPSKSPKQEYYDWENPRTGKTHRVPEGLDPGWDHNAGKDALAKTRDLMAEKIQALPAEYQAAVRRALTIGEQAITAATLPTVAAPPVAATPPTAVATPPAVAPPTRNLDDAIEWAEGTWAGAVRLKAKKPRTWGGMISSKKKALEKLNAMNAEVHRLREKWPKVRWSVGRFYLTTSKRGLAHANLKAINASMTIGDEWTPEMFATQARWAKRNYRNWNWVHQEAHRAYTVRHEFGHILTGEYGLMAHWLTIWDRYHNTKIKLPNGHLVSWWQKHVSNYAGTDADEALAESLAMYTSSYYNGNRAFPKDITDFLDKLLDGGFA